MINQAWLFMYFTKATNCGYETHNMIVKLYQILFIFIKLFQYVFVFNQKLKKIY